MLDYNSVFCISLFAVIPSLPHPNFTRLPMRFLVLLPFVTFFNCCAYSADSSSDVPAGHSYHGEAFNEGPRQAAVRLPGMAKITFPTSTKNELAQAFVEQGIAQLHGFWYLEAERSFRQAAKEDPSLAIAYWGLAMANKNNAKRARGFIDEAKKKSQKGTSQREKMYIDALDRYLPKDFDDDDTDPEDKEPTDKEPTDKEPTDKEPTDKEPTDKEPTDKEPTDKEPTDKEPTDKEPTDKEPTDKEPTDKEPTDKEPTDKEPTDKEPTDKEPTDKEKEREAKKKRTERYLADLENILHKFPDDIEAKAFLVVQLWMGKRDGVKLTSNYAVSALLGEIFDENPVHPAHHYRIHLWDSPHPENALESAAKCGPSCSGIAHMWHMPGHIYSKLKRYRDAAWQQEASARVDHSHMIRTRLLPDQIHNFAHNNEWLVRNLIFLGRVHDAIDLSKNLISLPRHPKFNSADKRGSYRYGRERLTLVLTQYELWQQYLDEIENGTLELDPESDSDRDLFAWKGVAHFMLGQRKEGGRVLRLLHRKRIELETESLDLADKVDKDEPAEASTQQPEAEGDEQDEKPDVDPKKRLEGLKKQRETIRKLISRVAAASAAKRQDKKTLGKHLEKAGFRRHDESSMDVFGQAIRRRRSRI